MCNSDFFISRSQTQAPTAHVEIPCHARGCTHVHTYAGPEPVVEGIKALVHAHEAECVGAPGKKSKFKAKRIALARQLEVFRTARAGHTSLPPPYAAGRPITGATKRAPRVWLPAYTRRARTPPAGPGALNRKAPYVSVPPAELCRARIATKKASNNANVRVLRRGAHRKRVDVRREAKKARSVRRDEARKVKEWTKDSSSVPAYEGDALWQRHCPSAEYEAWLQV